MSAVEELTVVLEHDIDEQYQYQPGEVLRGNVCIKVVRPTAIRTITIRAVGEGNVSWKENGKGAVIQAEEKYVDVSQVILETKQQEPRNLDPGQHKFSFEYQLPDNLPSSYIGKFGNVTYTMKATVTGVNSIDTSITSEPFLVLRRSPLPESAKQSLNLSQEKRLWGSCSFGKVSARLTLESQGGVPGQDLFMHAELKNYSHRTVTAMQASLVMLSTYHARNSITSFRQVVSKKRDEFDVTRNEGRRWNYVRLVLPPYIPETRLECCDIIEIDYIFQFRVEISGGAELIMEQPILIGSHLPGQEGQRRGIQSSTQAVNSQWTVHSQGFRKNSSERAQLDLGENQHDWKAASAVPEMRADKVVITNPLFQQSSAARPEVMEIPEEQMENTRL